ncbi:MAG: TetR-like C-terminal domain-containing protein [Yoonia sp.]
MLETDGPDALGISSVAAELKIRPASMYNHVASAEALANAVALAGHRRVLAALDTASEGLADPREHLRTLAYSVRRWAAENKGLYGHLARVEPNYGDEETAAVLHGILSLFDQPLKALGISNDQRVHAMRAIRSAIHGFVLLELSGQFQLQEAPDDSFRWMVDSLILGLAERHGNHTTSR